MARKVYVPLKLPDLGYSDTENKIQRNFYSSSYSSDNFNLQGEFYLGKMFKNF